MAYFSIGELPSTPMLPGIERRAAWLEGVMLTFFVFQPGSIVPEHQHPNEQITIVTRGAMQFTLAGETRILRKGDGACIPPNVPHNALVLDELTEAYDAWNPPRDDYKVQRVQSRNGVDTSGLLPDFVVDRAQEDLHCVARRGHATVWRGRSPSAPYEANLSTVASELVSDAASTSPQFTNVARNGAARSLVRTERVRRYSDRPVSCALGARGCRGVDRPHYAKDAKTAKVLEPVSLCAKRTWRNTSRGVRWRSKPVDDFGWRS